MANKIDLFGIPRDTASIIKFTDYTGLGAVNTVTPVFSTATVDGTDLINIQNTDSGCGVKVTTPGIYHVMYLGDFTGGNNIGVTKNGAGGSTQVQAQTAAVLVCLTSTSAANAWGCAAGYVYCRPGDILRPCGQGGAAGATNLQIFTVAKV